MKTGTLHSKCFAFLISICLCWALTSGEALADRPEIGTTIDHTNWEQYKEYLAPGVQEQIKRNYLSYVVVEKHKHVDMPIEAWTEKCKGQAKVGPNGELVDYCNAGIPFPDVTLDDPQAPTKLAWNWSKRYVGDTLLYSPSFVYQIDKKGHERKIKSEMLVYKEMERVVVPPIPAVPGSNVRVRWRLNTLAPYDVKGIATLLIRYQDEQVNADQQWIYIPTLKRTRRMSTAQKGDTWAGTDLTYDDFLVERVMDFTYKVIDFKEMLIVSYCDMDCINNVFRKRQGFKIYNMPVEFQQIYAIETVSKNPAYHYGKMVFYIDPEYWQVNLKECFDVKMELWKIQTNYGCMASGIAGARIGSMMDLQADHATVWEAAEGEQYNIDLPLKEFDVMRLKEVGE